jgi:transposase-like protein
MSQKNRRRFDGEFKTKVVLEALKERKTMNALAKEHSIHPQQITDWKKLAIDQLPTVFGKETPAAAPDLEAITAPLYQKIGQLEVELDYLRRVQKKLLAT